MTLDLTQPTPLLGILRRKAMRGTPRGFTLMELVVASALMTALMAGLWSLVNVFTSLGERGTGEFRRIGEATQFFHWLQTDLRAIPQLTTPGGEPSLRGDASTLDFALVVPPSLQWLGQTEQQAHWHDRPLRYSTGSEAADSPMADFPSPWDERSTSDPRTSSSTPAPATPPAVRRIRYQFHMPDDAPSGDGQHAQHGRPREVWRYDERSTAGDMQWFGAALKFSGVEAVRFRYYDGRRWASRWDSAMQDGLPLAVRIETWFFGGNPLAAPNIDVDQRGSQLDATEFEPDNFTDSAVEDSNPFGNDAFEPLDAIALPDRPADLTRWVALQ